MKRGWIGSSLRLGLCAGIVMVPVLTASAASVDDLQQQLSDQQQALAEVNQKIKDFQDKIAARHSEANTLNDQISLLDDNIEGLQLAITKTTAQVNETNIEID